ncbi:unnamed protein product [Schistocephalus solidus]|uniref:Amino acid transporter n=1 Tax=Schistocephalus solidus TaxID=70667 RepID=A0A183SUA1_SCHSO|nr:unnamed protein product [Schistocephalus solidus]
MHPRTLNYGLVCYSTHFYSKGMPGELFLRALRFCVIPLLSCNIIAGVWAGNLAPTQPEIATPPPNISSMLMDLLRQMGSTLKLGLFEFMAISDVLKAMLTPFFLLLLKSRFLPIGVGSLVLRAISNINGADGTARALAMFVVTSFAYLGVITLVLLPTIYLIFVRRDFCKFLGLVIRPMLTAFSTLSSIAALPGVFKVCEQLGMNVQTAQLLGPFLTSFNANGSSAFIASSIIFCAQWAGHTISIGSIIAIFFLTGLNVMALPAVPSASIILVILLVRSFRIPDTAIPFLFVTDFIM